MFYNSLLVLLIIFISGCSSKINHFENLSKKENIDTKLIEAICYVESKHTNNVVNVNSSVFNIQKGSHYFDSFITANMYMDLVLDPMLLNYDIGICQVNKLHLKKYNLDNEDLLDEETNISIALKILKWNLKKCNFNKVCALSMYNTGYKNSTIGKQYAKRVLTYYDKLKNKKKK